MSDNYARGARVIAVVLLTLAALNALCVVADIIAGTSHWVVAANVGSGLFALAVGLRARRDAQR